jgi:hypothetical protein
MPAAVTGTTLSLELIWACAYRLAAAWCLTVPPMLELSLPGAEELAVGDRLPVVCHNAQTRARVQCAKGTHMRVCMYGHQWLNHYLNYARFVCNAYRVDDQILLCYKRQPSYHWNFIQMWLLLTDGARSKLHGCSENVLTESLRKYA